MNLTGTVSPVGVEVSLTINEADLALAFGGESPDVELFFKVFHPKRWSTLSVSEKTLALSKITFLVEQAGLASSLNLTAGSPEPKR